MNYLLFGGFQNVGKSETVWRTAQSLINKGFSIIAQNKPFPLLQNPFPNPFPDFIIVLKGKDKTGNTIIVLLNSPTDYDAFIDELKAFLDGLPIKIDIIISTIKDADHPTRRYFFKIFPINPSIDFKLEIPLAKISKQRGDFSIALDWYRKEIDNLVEYTLSNHPFNI
jgi:hypothetical protein